MEKTILSKKIIINTAPIHIAPGGSALFHLVAPANVLKSLLSDLREEIAYGMADVETVSDSESLVRIDIYMGLADVDDYMRIFAQYADKIQSFEREDLPEGTERTGFTMGSRNEVIGAL